jgi:hypothetical protein
LSKLILTYGFITALFLYGCSSVQDNDTNKLTNSPYQTESPKKTALSPDEYMIWSGQPNNFLIREKTISEFNYKIKYLPTEQLIINDLKKSDKEITVENIAQLEKEYEGMEYFEMRVQVDQYNDELAKYQISDISEYQTRIAYMAFAMKNNITLSTEFKESIPCKLFHFERTYGITPYTTFLFAFSKEDIADAYDRTVVYDDELFNKGRLKFNWSFENVELPKIASL